MTVYIPTALRSYTGRKPLLELSGRTLAELLDVIEQHHPGLRFRVIDEQDGIRDHIKLFVNSEQVLSLQTELRPQDEIHIICALSGG